MNIKVQTKECHVCGLIVEQWESAYASDVCSYCGSQLCIGTRIAPGDIAERENEIYQKYIAGDSDKVKKFEERHKEEKERAHKSEPVTLPSEPNCIPKCPTCGSTNVQRISTANRLGSTLLFGLASSKIGKTMECKNCGYKW